MRSTPETSTNRNWDVALLALRCAWEDAGVNVAMVLDMVAQG